MLVPLSAAAAEDADPAERPLPEHPRMADVCQLRVEDRRLVLHCPLAGPRPRRHQQLRVEDLSGDGTVFLRIGPAGERPDVPTTFNFSCHSNRVPGAIVVQTTLNASPAGLALHRHCQTRDGWSIVSLTQENDLDPFARGRSISLTLARSSAPDSRQTFTAPDWLSLRRRYPAAVDEHLRPLFRELRQFAIFGVEPAVAWQVFAEDWQPDPEVARRVLAEIPRLDSDRFVARDAAYQAIAHEGMAAALFLDRMDRTGLTPEQAARVNAFLSNFTFVNPDDADRLRASAEFLLDCLYSDDSRVRVIALKHLSHLAGRTIEIDWSAPEDLRNTSIDALRRELLYPQNKPTTTPAQH